MYRFGSYMPGDGWLLGLLVVVAVILLIAFGIAWILRRDVPRDRTPMPPPPPMPPSIDPAVQILRERFARGEIGEAEFVSASRTLGAPLPPPGPRPDAPRPPS